MSNYLQALLALGLSAVINVALAIDGTVLGVDPRPHNSTPVLTINVINTTNHKLNVDPYFISAKPIKFPVEIMPQDSKHHEATYPYLFDITKGEMRGYMRLNSQNHEHAVRLDFINQSVSVTRFLHPDMKELTVHLVGSSCNAAGNQCDWNTNAANPDIKAVIMKQN